MSNLRKRLILLMILVLAISFAPVVSSLQAGSCSDAFENCLNNMSTSWWKGPLDFIECVADLIACFEKKY